MSDTNLSLFSNGCSQLVSVNVLQPVVKYLAEKKSVSVTVEELLEVLSLPVTAAGPLTNGPLTTRVVPAMAFGGGAAATSRGKSSAASTVSQVHVPGTCAYRFQRGDKRGKFCGKVCVPGSEYCAACSKNVSKSKKGQDTTVPTSGVAVGFMQNSVSEQEANDGDDTIDAEPYDEENGLIRTKKENFIIKQVGDDYAVVGYLDGKSIVPLNEQQKTVAQQMGLKLMQEQAVAVAATAVSSGPQLARINPLHR